MLQYDMALTIYPIAYNFEPLFVCGIATLSQLIYIYKIDGIWKTCRFSAATVTANEGPRSIRYSQPVPSTGSPYKAGGCISFNISTCLWRSSSFKTTLYNPPAVFWPCIVLYLICLATVMYMHALCRLNGNPQERLVESVAKVQSLHAFAEFCRHC